MASSKNGLTLGGLTRYYDFSYDDTLPAAAGRDLVNAVMQTCDSDFALMASWFVGITPADPLPVLISSPGANDVFGAEWTWGAFGQPSITLLLGNQGNELLARYVLVAEVTEIFMFTGHTQWFAVFDEGSIGEALSRFLSIEFLKATHVTNPQGVVNGFAVAGNWLNSGLASDGKGGLTFDATKSRQDFLATNIDDNQPDAVTGCGTLFLNFLHYQLGFSIQQIIGAGASTLADVFATLTKQSRETAFSSFRDLVNLHYPQDATGQPLYLPPLDNLFPAPNLSSLTAPVTATWIQAGNPKILHLRVDNAFQASISVPIASSNAALLPAQTAKFNNGNIEAFVPFFVSTPPNPATFAATQVTVTASYAGMMQSATIQIVKPSDFPMPPLSMVVSDADLCAKRFAAGSAQNFAVANAQAVFAGARPGLTFAWSVTGATISGSSSAASVTLGPLPQAGTDVTLSVTLTNADGLRATGSLSFQTVAPGFSLTDLTNEIQCRVRQIKNIQQFVPPEDPITITGDRLRTIETQALQVIRNAEAIVVAVRRFQAAQSGAKVSRE